MCNCEATQNESLSKSMICVENGNVTKIKTCSENEVCVEKRIHGNAEHTSEIKPQCKNG